MRQRLLLLAALLAGSHADAAETRQVVPDAGFPVKGSPEAAIYRGAIVFQHYCVLCHGIHADGAGRAAKLYTPKPANLLTSDKNDQYKALIIRQGGKALGRSESMPAWGRELTDEQIADTVAFLHSIRSSKVENK